MRALLLTSRGLETGVVPKSDFILRMKQEELGQDECAGLASYFSPAHLVQARPRLPGDANNDLA